MAKAMVKCPYCGEMFDRNDPSIKWIKVNERRYAHQECYDKYQASLSKEERDKEELYKYARQVLGKTIDFPKVKKQIKQFHDENEYTYSGMLGSLKYFYEVKNGSAESAKGGVGIIPYVYNEARDYFYKIYAARQKVENKEVKTEVEVITIPSPRMWAPPPKLWLMDDEEDDN